MDKKERKKLIINIIIIAIPLLSIFVFYVFRENRRFAQSIIDGFSFPIREMLGTISSYLPFSVMELMYTAIGIWIIFFAIKSILKIIRGKGRRIKIAAKRILILASVAAYIWTGYCWLWGIDYYGASFEEKSGFYAKAVTKEDLVASTAYFVQMANEYSKLVERDDDGHFAEDMKAYFDDSKRVYDVIGKEFPCLEMNSRMPKKMIYSKIMSIMGFTGIYFPFSGETNINIDAPDAFIPCTIAHELAHQRGIYSEAECNFLGVTSCVTSGLTVYEYSGYLSGMLYLMNALYKVDKDSWMIIRQSFSEELETDWNDNNEYWARMETKVAEAAETVYDSYLKASGQELGMRSYGACVDLIVTYFAPTAKEYFSAKN